MSSLAVKVYSIEIIPELGEAARKTLKRLGYLNVKTKIGDGYLGSPDRAPFDGIIVTAAPDHIPAALVDQLKPNRRMVIPVGGLTQDLMVVTQRADGTSTPKTIVPVRFVPLTRE
jgi:protein-L-isoaspartate(D-aspartate) O-methyltransferase